MKTEFNRKSVIAILAAFSCAAQAALVVDFDDATQVLVDSGLTGASFALDTGTPTYAPDGVNYTGPAIYAAMNEHSATLMSLKPGDGTRIRMNDSTANGGEALFMFKTPAVSFEAGMDVLNIGSAFVSTAARLDSATMRFVVEEAGQFYISDASASHATSYSVNALTANWFAYDPSTIAGVSVIGAAATPAFASIDSIGYLLSADGPAIGGDGVNFGVTKFTATAGTPPPPTVELDVPVWEGIDGCVFQMDAKEHYRFAIDSTDQRVTGWDGVYGVGQVDASTSRRPLYVESGFNGINVLDLPADCYLDCVFDAPVNEFQVFVVYWPDSAAPAALVVDFDDATQVLVDSGLTGASFALDTGTPKYASDGTNYTGPAIYAAMNERLAGTKMLMSLKAGAGTQIRMNDSTANGGEALFMFKTPGVSFKAGVDVLSIGSAFVSTAARLDSATMRFVVEEAGQFYISDASASHATSYSVNALTANWYAYDPSTIAGVSGIGTAATPAFASIDSIGYLLSAEGPAIGGGGVNFGVTKFTAQAGGQEVLIDNPDFEVELWTSSDAAPAIAVGTASGLSDMDRLFLGKTYNGRVAEVVVFNHLLSVEEEQLVYDRLNVKWIERVSRDVPNLFKTLLGKTDAQFDAARATVSTNLLYNWYDTAEDFRGDTNTIFRRDINEDDEVRSAHDVEWVECILLGMNDKAMFDKSVNLFEDYHWHWDAVVGQWYFNDAVFESGEEYRSTYVGQGNHYGLATVLYQAYAKWREPRYLELADRHANFWQAHDAYEDPGAGLEMIYSGNNSAGFGKGVIKMSRGDSLGLDAYTECTYMKPLGCRLAAEFGASVDAEFYDLAPHAQNQWLLRGSHPVTGLVPATSDLQGNPVEHKDERWARYCDDPTEKVWDRYLNSMINYPQDMDAGLLESFNKVAAWAAGIGVNNFKNDYELDGTCTNVNVVYKGNSASEGGIATIAAMAQVVDTDLTPWVQRTWDDVGNTDRSQRGYVRAFFTIAGLTQVQNDGLRKNYVSNPGLETPASTNGWDVSGSSCRVVTNAARRGSYGLSCTNNAPSPQLDASTFKPGATYRYTAWVRSTSGTGTYAIRCQLNSTTTQWEQTIGSEWQLIGYDFTLPVGVGTTSIRLWVQGGTGSTFDLDDVNIVLVRAPIGAVEPMKLASSPTTMWNDWIALYPGVGAHSNLYDDADGDLFNNLTEYAFGGEPDNALIRGNTPVQPKVSYGVTNYIEYVYHERNDAAVRGLSSLLTVGTDLVLTNWADGSAYKVGSGASGIAGFNAVTNWIPTDVESKQFIRLQIKFAP